MVSEDTFDEEGFLEWLDDQHGAISMETMDERWPNYPWERVGRVTVALGDDGESLYFRDDLRRAVKGVGIID